MNLGQSQSKFDLSIIILNWNTKELLKQCLESVISYQLPVTGEKKKPVTDNRSLITEIIVVDNGSTDGSVEMINELFINGLTDSKKKTVAIRLIENKENLGFSRGNNQALRQARGEYVMLLNSDTIVKEGALKKLVEYLDKNPKIAAVSPLILNEDGSVQKDPCYLKFPTPLTVFLYYNPLLRKIALNLFPGLLLSLTRFDQPGEVSQLPGAAIVLRAEVLRKVGGLDERYPHFFEDVDLSFQLQKLGYKLAVVPDARIVHLGGQSLKLVIDKEGLEKRCYLNFHALFLFCQKNYSGFKTQTIKFIIFTQFFLTGKFSLIKKLS